MTTANGYWRCSLCGKYTPNGVSHSCGGAIGYSFQTITGDDELTRFLAKLKQAQAERDNSYKRGNTYRSRALALLALVRRVELEASDWMMQMLAEARQVGIQRNRAEAAERLIDELRRSVALSTGNDPNTWPGHGNAPLLKQAVEIIAGAEWGAQTIVGHQACDVCGNTRKTGHRSDCQFALTLAALRAALGEQ